MKILLIGNSYSSHWTDELCGLLNAAGHKDVRVSNVYYSGCTFEKHWNWYVNKEENYKLQTIKDGVRTIDKPVGLEYCLSAEKDWDIISFQQTNRYGYSKDGGEAHRNSIKAHLPQLYDLVHSRFPNAKYYWLQSWAHEIRQSDEGSKGVKDLDAQLAASAIFRNVGKEVCAEYGFTGVPCGDAWELIRHDPIFYEKGEGDFPVRSLHTRIYEGSKYKGMLTNKDLSHDGNVGGGQYLNGCVWFEMITHKSVIGNSFRPHYDYQGLDMHLNEKKIEMLQNAAHQAVLNYYGEEWYK